MSKLLAALRKKYKTPEDAIEALGLDVNLLKSAVTGDSRPNGLSRLHKLARDMKRARDDEPDEQFEREQLAGPGEGEDDDFPHTAAHPELAAILRAKGFSDKEVESCCAAAVNDSDMASDDVDDRLDKLRDYLKRQGMLSEDEISEALEIARTSMGMDDPTDLAHGGEPRPGGQRLTPFRPDGSGNTKKALNPVRNERGEAMDASYAKRWPEVARIQCDNSIGVQHFAAPPSPQSRKKAALAADAAHTHSSRAQASYFERFPNAAKIGFA